MSALPPCDLSRQSLFFDFDGTLIPLASEPDAAIVPDGLIPLLERLTLRMPGRVAVVSGRCLAQLDHFLGDFAREIAIAGSHGAELRLPGYETSTTERPDALDLVAAAFADFSKAHGIVLEHKALGVGLHFTMAPHVETAALELGAALAQQHGLVLQRGKMMVEVRAPGNKGLAVARLLQMPAMQGSVPLFFGDDVTDEDGFRAVAAAGGSGVLIGALRASDAVYHLPDVAAVHDWITQGITVSA